jgi:hypothetical protein
MNQLEQLGKDQPYSICRNRTTLFTQSDDPETLLDAIEHFIEARIAAKRKRLSGPLQQAPHLFAKTYKIRSFPARLRITFNLKRRIGGYDWAVTEIFNNIRAEALNAPTPRLIGFGYTRGRSGLIQEVFLINENLAAYSNGTHWLSGEDRIEEFVSRALALIQELNGKHIYHLDPWAGNIMLATEGSNPTRMIDLENCVIGETPHSDATLGFQVGYLYQIRMKGLISESRYDTLVRRAMAERQQPCGERFEEAYSKYKSQRICKKNRRAIVTRGELLDD